MFLADGPIGYTPRPANLNGVRGAYAIYMVGDSMEPRYEQGWLLHVNPFKPPTRGRDVVVYKTGPGGADQAVRPLGQDALLLRQLNPPQELRVPRDGGPSNATSSSASTRRAEGRKADPRPVRDGVNSEALSGPRAPRYDAPAPDHTQEPPTCAPASPSTT